MICYQTTEELWGFYADNRTQAQKSLLISLNCSKQSVFRTIILDRLFPPRTKNLQTLNLYIFPCTQHYEDSPYWVLWDHLEVEFCSTDSVKWLSQRRSSLEYSSIQTHVDIKINVNLAGLWPPGAASIAAALLQGAHFGPVQPLRIVKLILGGFFILFTWRRVPTNAILGHCTNTIYLRKPLLNRHFITLWAADWWQWEEKTVF